MTNWTELNNNAVIVLYFTLLNEGVCVSTVINVVKLIVIVVVCYSVAKLCLTLCNPTDSSIPGFPVLHHLLKFAQTPVHESKMPSNHLILYCHLFLPLVFPSIRVFSNESALHIRCQSTGTSASASVLPMNIQCWFPLGLAGLISLLSKGLDIQPKICELTFSPSFWKFNCNMGGAHGHYQPAEICLFTRAWALVGGPKLGAGLVLPGRVTSRHKDPLLLTRTGPWRVKVES